MTTRMCACGCGQALPADSRPGKLYIDLTHKNRGRGVMANPARPSKAADLTLRQVRSDNASLRNDVIRLQTELERMEFLLDRFSFVGSHLEVPKWLTTKPTKKASVHHAMPVFMLSDLHLDEVVDFDEMDGINEYNRAIAERRLHRLVESVVKLLKRYVSGVEFDGLLVALLGDMITGVIHDELARTNEAPPSASIVYWVPVLVSALVYLADELDIPIHVAAVDGNHDRFYGKPHHKKRAETGLAWIIYNWMESLLKNDDRITFSLTTSAEQLVDVYDTTLMLSHGDTFRSQGGVGGLYPSMLKWLLRRHQQYTMTRRDFDFALIGHWHQLLAGQDFFVNGSMKGYDEYAKNLGFLYEVPRQHLFIVTPERGVTNRLEVHAE